MSTVHPLRSSGIDHVGPNNAANDTSRQRIKVAEGIGTGFEPFGSRFTCYTIM